MSQSKASGRKSVAGMGSIRKKEKVINGKAYTYYEARYTVGIDPGTGKQIQKSISGKTQREVTRRLKEITTSIDTGTYLPSCKLTVGEWLNTWISEYTADWKPLTVSNYSKQIKKHLIPRLGAAKLEDLDTHTIQLFYNSLTKSGLAPKTVKNIHGVLHAALEQAISNGYRNIDAIHSVSRIEVEALDLTALIIVEHYVDLSAQQKLGLGCRRMPVNW